jgi:hypothetical protein
MAAEKILKKIDGNSTEVGEYLLLEPLVLKELDSDDFELKLKNFLKIIQQMWKGIQSILSDTNYREVAKNMGFMSEKDIYEFNAATTCKSSDEDEHLLLRCYTSRVMFNYMFKELNRNPATERMVVEDAKGEEDPTNITVNTYNIWGPQFPDHTFITIETKESFYLLQSFYYEYSYGSLYGLTKLNSTSKYIFNQIIAAYQKYNLQYIKNKEEIDEINRINETFKLFTGIDTDKHDVYLSHVSDMITENESLISTGNPPKFVNSIEINSVKFPLLFYCGSLNLKIYNMLHFIYEKYESNIPNDIAKTWSVYDAYKQNPLVAQNNDTLSIYSGYENIQLPIIKKGNEIKLKYIVNGTWVKQFYFYVAMIYRVFKEPILDFENQCYIELFLKYNYIFDSLPDLEAIIGLIGCTSISTVKDNKISSIHEEKCEQLILFISNQIFWILKEHKNKLDMDILKTIEKQSSLPESKFRSKVFKKRSSRKSHKASRKSNKVSRKSNKVSRKSNRVSRKSHKTSRKSKKTRKSHKASRKSYKISSRKSYKVSRKSKKTRKSLRKSKKTRKSHKASRKSHKASRKSHKASRKSHKASRKSHKASRKSHKASRKSHKASRKS